jgi:hypothetical protein
MTNREFERSIWKIGVALVAAICLFCAISEESKADEPTRVGGPFNITPSGWDMETRILHDTYQVAHAVDCVQTYYIAKHPELYREVGLSWFLGGHPSKESVAVWCVSQAYLYSVITQMLVDGDASPGVRRVFSAVTIGLTVNTVQRNYAIGIKWGL